MAKINTINRPQWSNYETAKLLRQIAAAYTILGENRFKIVAYDNAATSVEHATSELKDLWDNGELATVPGLGPAIQGHLDELFQTGKSKHFQEILAKVNPAVFPLLDVPGLGPKKAHKLTSALGLKNPKTVVADLLAAAKNHKIAEIAAFGEKSAEDLMKNIQAYTQRASEPRRMPLPLASELAENLTTFLQTKLPGKIRRVDALGSLRRQVTTVGDIDIAVVTSHPEEVISAFTSYPSRTEIIEKGSTGASIRLPSGRQADLRVAGPESYGAMLQYFTGSKYHNIRLRDFALKKGFSLNEYGIKSVKTGKIHRFVTEEEFYHFLGLDYIPPELREDNGEIEAALNHRLPELIALNDIRGDLQVHSNFDLQTSHDAGVDTIATIRGQAETLGYDYVAITNHNPSTSGHTPEEVVRKIKKQKEYLDHLNRQNHQVKILNLLEVDIGPTGQLPVPPTGLEMLDACLVSIHSQFNLGKSQMTKRVIAGLSHPQAKILAHPTGRLLQRREGYELDWETLFAFCRKNDKALEINAYPDRLDLPDTLVREAVRSGVKLSLGTDAHRVSDMGLMRFGVAVARRGWVTKKDVINTWEYAKIISWLRKR